MDTEAMLLAAIHAYPGDDLARQALADWLEEQGDLRGQLLRWQLNLRQYPDSASVPEWEEGIRTLLAQGVRPCVPILTNSLGMQLALIPSGTFLMGSPEGVGQADEHPQHEVQISQPFYLGVFPVTQAQWRAVMGNNPSWFCATGDGKNSVKGLNTDHFPVEQVSWEDVQTFLDKLAALKEEREMGRKYRLPTEAEWEYACRGGASSYQEFHFGNSLSSTQANFNGNYPYGGAAEGSYLGRTSKVGSYPPNAFGLYDLHGNVWEWTSTERRSVRVIRGGSWLHDGVFCAASYRGRREPAHAYYYLGFRLLAVPVG
jgi:uncharacterized protein (TIGR02996 family)